VGINSTWNDSLMAGTVNLFKSKTALASFLSEGRKGFISFGNITNSLFQKLQESATKFTYTIDKSLMQFNMATLAAGKYDDQIKAIDETYYDTGVTFDKQAANFQNLMTNTAQFRLESDGVQKSLTATVSVLERMGVSQELSAQNYQYLTRVMKLTGAQAERTMVDISSLAQSLNITVAQAHSDFARMQDSLAIYGDRQIKIFTNLEIMAKRTGVAIDRFADISAKFKNFESAVTSAQMLNATLQGPFFSGMELLKASFEGQDVLIQKLREGFGRWGQDINSLNPAIKEIISNMAGTANWSEFMKIFGDETNKAVEEEKRLQAQSERLNMSVEELREQSEKYKTVEEDLAVLQRTIAKDMQPVLTAFKELVRLIVDTNKQFDGVPIKAIIVTMVLGKLVHTIGSTVEVGKTFISVLPKLGKAAADTALPLKDVASSTKDMGDNFKKAQGPIQQSGPAMEGAGKGGAKGSTGLLYFAAAAIGVGIGVAGIGAGIWLAAEGMSTLLDIIIKNIDVMPDAISSINQLTGAFSGLSTQMIPLMGIVGAVGALGVALQLLDTDALQGAAALSGNLAKLGAMGPSAAAAFDPAIDVMLDAISSINQLTGAFVGLSTQMIPLLGVVGAVGALGVALQLLDTDALRGAAALSGNLAKLGAMGPSAAEGMSTLLDIIIKNIDVMPDAISSINQLSGAFVDLSAQMIPLLGVVDAVGALGVALQLLDTDALRGAAALSGNLAKLGAMGPSAAEAFDPAGEFIMKTALATNIVDDEGAKNLTQILHYKSEIAKHTNTTTVQFVKETRELLKEVQNNNNAGATSNPINLAITFGTRTIRRVIEEGLERLEI